LQRAGKKYVIESFEGVVVDLKTGTSRMRIKYEHHDVIETETIEHLIAELGQDGYDYFCNEMEKSAKAAAVDR
jgi:hypothetical protein